MDSTPIAKLALGRLTNLPGEVATQRASLLSDHLREENFSDSNLSALANERLLASTTLLKEMYLPGSATAGWIAANSLMLQALKDSRTLDCLMIFTLHQTLVPEGESGLRTNFVQGGNTRYPEASALNELFDIFLKKLEENSGLTPILKAAFVYQWIITLHFFNDANGRLARLCADYILLSAELPPLSFQHDLSGFVSALSEPDYFTVDDSVAIICEGISHSTNILRS